MSDNVEKLLKQPIPSGHDDLAIDHDRTFAALTEVQHSINRITRDLARNSQKTSSAQRDRDWTANAKYAKSCLILTAERLKMRLGEISKRRRNFRHHEFIHQARRLLDPDLFKSIMDATRRQKSRRASA